MRVFVETSVIAYLTAEPSQDLIMASRQELTRLWWEEAASEFELFCSNTALKEAVKKDPKITQKQFECLQDVFVKNIHQSSVGLVPPTQDRHQTK
jgi:environmental stress-induced protein Ves